jgi:O-antigen/teichoic acid export membrane protein
MAEDQKKSNQNLGGKLMSGSIWMIAMRWSMRLLGLVSTAILARLLTPEDFGLVAMSAIAVGFIEIFSQLGVELALIRHPNPQRRHYDTAWTFNILTGLFLGAVMVLVAPYAAAYFGEPRVEPVLWVLALAPLIKGAVNIGTLDFRKDLQFSKDFQFNFIPRIAAFFTTITLALVFRNYWALVIGTMMHGVYMLIVSFIIHPYRPWFSLQEHRSLLPSSFWVVVKTMGDFVIAKLDQLIVVRSLGTEATGIYYLSAEISRIATFSTILPIGRALHPGYVKLIDEPERLASAYLKVFAFIVTIAASIGFGLSAVSKDFIAVVLGSQWSTVVPVIEILAVSQAAMAISISVSPLLQAAGNFRGWAMLIWMIAFVLVCALMIGVAYGGLMAIAWAHLGGSSVVMFLTVLVSANLLSTSYWRVFRVMIRPLLASAIMYVTVVYLHLDSLDLPAVTLILDMAVGMVSYGVALLGLWFVSGQPDGMESDILERLKIRVPKRSLA